MKTDCLPFDIGIEKEFFICPRYKYHIILNAKEEMKKIFGFSIDQNDCYKGIPINTDCDIVTDGTAMEIRGFFPIDSCYFRENLKIAEKIIKSISQFNFLKPYYQSDIAYIKQGEISMLRYEGLKYTFNNPNGVFSSQKLVRDAYTGKESYQEKKDDKKVTIRTAGLHVHFSLQKLYKNADAVLFDAANRHHIDNLIKLFDKIYKQYFRIQEAMQKRIEFYQPFGIYRIKKPADGTKSGLHTIEYRQPASGQLDYCFDGFLLLCQNAAYNYLTDAKLI